MLLELSHVFPLTFVRVYQHLFTFASDLQPFSLFCTLCILFLNINRAFCARVYEVLFWAALASLQHSVANSDQHVACDELLLANLLNTALEYGLFVLLLFSLQDLDAN